MLANNSLLSESDGCPAIIKLENLQHHLSICEYNSNSVFSCDKETTKNNCSSHLANRVKAQEKDISNLIHELNNQKVHFEQVVNGELSNQKQHFEHMMKALQEQIRKLNDGSKKEITKLSRQLCNQREHFERIVNGLHNRKLIDSSETTLSHQRQEITDLSDKSKLSVSTVKWQVINNMIDKKNILSTAKKLYGCSGTLGYVQSRYYLEPTKSYCKIRMLNSSCKSSWIGLTCKVEGQFSFSLRISFIYASDGEVIVHNKHVLNGSAWKQGDVIECGITFPKNFIDNGNDKVLVYFTKNEEIVFKKPFKIRCNELFPTIQTFNDTRIEYINT